MSTCAFANAVLWKTRIYAKVSKCGIWKMRCTYYALGILLLLIFQVMSSNTDHWGVMKLCFPEKENLVSPSQWFHIVQLPFHLTPLFPPAPLSIRFLTNCSVTSTDSKVFSSPHWDSWRSAPGSIPPTFHFHTAFPRGDFCSDLLFCLVSCHLHMLKLLNTALSELSMLFLYY